MSSNVSDKPTTEEIGELKRLVAGIIRAQGNRFVKELLRAKKIRIGLNKDDFERNLSEAIDNGQLILSDVAAWLQSVEGWGNQHVYAYQVSDSLKTGLTTDALHNAVKTCGLLDVWDKSSATAFPEKPELTSISFHDSILTILWHETSTGWSRVPSKDRIEEDGLDIIELRAWRKLEERAITRFEVDLARGIAALFISDPVQAAEHQLAIDEAKRVIALLLDIDELERNQFDVSTISKNLDQQNTTNRSDRKRKITSQKSRLGSGRSYVEFGTDTADAAYTDEPAVNELRNAVRSRDLQAFQGINGAFSFHPEAHKWAPTRLTNIQLFGKDRRIRIRAQMARDEVWNILSTLSAYRGSA